MKNIFKTILGIAFLTGATAALAGGPDNMPPPAIDNNTEAAATSAGLWSFLPNGFVLGTDLGYAVTPSSEFNTISGATKVTDGFAFGFHAGYNFNPYIGLEGGYVRLPKIGYNVPGAFLGNNNNNMYSLVAKGMLTIDPQFSLFAKAGYAIITSDSTTSLPGYTLNGSRDIFYNPVVGAGAEYRFIPHLGVNAQYLAIIRVGHQYDTTHLITGGLNAYFF